MNAITNISISIAMVITTNWVATIKWNDQTTNVVLAPPPPQAESVVLLTNLPIIVWTNYTPKWWWTNIDARPSMEILQTNVFITNGAPGMWTNVIRVNSNGVPKMWDVAPCFDLP